MLRPELFAITENAVRDGLRVIESLFAGGKYLSQHWNFPSLSYFQSSGLPSFGIKHIDIPKDFHQLMQKPTPNSYTECHDPETIESWTIFWAYALGDDRLTEYWGIEDAGGLIPEHTEPATKTMFSDRYKKYKIFGFLSSIIEKYYYTHETFEYSRGLFLPIYQQWEMGVFSESLALDIVVPLIFLRFEFDHLDIAPGVAIERMSDEFQLSRCPTEGSTSSPQDYVLGAATHALVLKDWTAKNSKQNERNNRLVDIYAYSSAIDLIEAFFSALRIRLGVSTGYGQIIARPVGWSDSWAAWVPRSYTVRVREYPDYFENNGWHGERESIGASSLNFVGTLYTSITTEPRFRVPAKRLNAAFLRKNEEDSIIDVAIGLEALFVAGDKGETTYKLSMRIAALCSIYPFEDYPPERMLWLCKRMYDFRSAVVHGGTRVEKSRIIKLQEEKSLRAVTFGMSLLRHSLLSLAKRPEFLTAEALDGLLLNGGRDGDINTSTP